MSTLHALHGFFITGTDTEIGKTCVTAGLTRAFDQLGRYTTPIKSLAAGQTRNADGVWVNDDVAQLHAVQTQGMTMDEVGPLQFREPCAPHIAAKLEGCPIDRDTLLGAILRSASKGDFALIEGVGGFRVPLTADWDTADLAVDLAIPVVLVVGLRLGCINHALLTAEAVLSRGLKLAGWVANTADPHQPHMADNLAALRARLDEVLGVPCWGHVPRLQDPSPAAVAAHLQQPQLLNALKA